MRTTAPVARLVGVSALLPERRMSTGELERLLAERSPTGWQPPPGFLVRLTGVRYRHVADGRNASDLAVAAARKLLADTGRVIDEIDLLIFASASQDMVEPATAHMVAAALDARCPVFDVKNACNSMLNGMQVAEALIVSGQHRRVLVVTGETPSAGVRWAVRDGAQFLRSLPGYTLSDAGAAVLLEAGPPGSAGIVHRAFSADSRCWPVGTLPGGGSAHPRGDEHTYFRIDGRRLRAAFEQIGPGLFLDGLDRLGLTWRDFAVVAVHQVATAHLARLAELCGIPSESLVETVREHGNVASASLPLQLATAIEAGRCGPGDRVALLGLAGGISLGMMVIEL